MVEPAASPCQRCQVSGRTVQILLGSSSPRLIRSKATWVAIIFAIEAGGMRRFGILGVEHRARGEVDHVGDRGRRLERRRGGPGGHGEGGSGKQQVQWLAGHELRLVLS